VSAAAAAGGFTAICALADNQPVTQNKSQVEYIIRKSQHTATTILPVGAVTENFDGKTPTEMYDMHHAGAVAFSDMPHAIGNAGVLARALQYARPFGGLIITMPYENSLAQEGQVNESAISVRMGLKGIPNVSEYVALQRDLEILRYSGGKLHVMGLSCKESVDLIRKAKKAKLPVTASVFVHHLVSTEESVSGYDSHFKVFPPLRTKKDQQALLDGLQDGTIDCISAQHTPLDSESKNLEFEYASFGMIGLETAFALLATKTGLTKKQLINAISVNPNNVLNRKNTISENSTAELAIIDWNEKWTISKKDIRSKSENSPYIGETVKGRVKGIFNKGKFLKF
jgi:dihydroorotase